MQQRACRRTNSSPVTAVGLQLYKPGGKAAVVLCCTRQPLHVACIRKVAVEAVGYTGSLERAGRRQSLRVLTCSWLSPSARLVDSNTRFIPSATTTVLTAHKSGRSRVCTVLASGCLQHGPLHVSTSEPAALPRVIRRNTHNGTHMRPHLHALHAHCTPLRAHDQIPSLLTLRSATERNV